MIRFFPIIIFVIFSVNAGATEQIDDSLSVGGKRYNIYELPLNQLYDYDALSAIIQQKMCSASWRGYKANWFLKNDYLWLQSIRKNPCHDEYEYIESSVLFKEQVYPVKAHWFTGSISLPVGEINYIYGTSEDDLLGYDLDVFVFKFKNGKLVSKGMEVFNQRYEKP